MGSDKSPVQRDKVWLLPWPHPARLEEPAYKDLSCSAPLLVACNVEIGINEPIETNQTTPTYPPPGQGEGFPAIPISTLKPTSAQRNSAAWRTLCRSSPVPLHTFG